MSNKIKPSARHAKETGLTDILTPLCGERVAATLELTRSTTLRQTASVISNHIGCPPSGAAIQRTQTQPFARYALPVGRLVSSRFFKTYMVSYSTQIIEEIYILITETEPTAVGDVAHIMDYISMKIDIKIGKRAETQPMCEWENYSWICSM